MKCDGIHCDGCSRGGGGSIAALALLVIIIGAAAKTGSHAIARFIEITGYVLTAIAVTGAAGAIGYGTLRVRRRKLATRTRRISPPVRAVVLTGGRTGRPVAGQVTPGRFAGPGQLEPPVRWALDDTALAESQAIAAMGRQASVSVPPEPAGAWIRASDQERDTVLSMLRDAYAAGRLSITEFDDRTSAAYVALTWGDLRPLTEDLPAWPGGDQ